MTVHTMCHCGAITTDESKHLPTCAVDPLPERELRFKLAVLTVINRGEHPSGVRIRRELGVLRFPTDGNLNGEATRWRREVLEALGWTRPAVGSRHSPDTIRGRWRPPEEDR